MMLRFLRCPLAAGVILAATLAVKAQDEDSEEPPAPEPGRPAVAENSIPTHRQATGARRALIVVGLPGDEQHRLQFREVVAHWMRWLTLEMQFKEQDIVVLAGSSTAEPPAKRPATRAAIEEAVDQLKRRSQPNDVCWIFTLGHGDYDDEYARLHLPGPDLHDKAFAELFVDLKCREQVFWLTHSCSGWFLKPLSRKARIVITATAAELEDNETEFPYALATLVETQAAADENGDGRISIAELFRQAAAGAEARFAADQRAPTEHAMLDDNGDGRGDEPGALLGAAAGQAEGVAGVRRPDGELAARTFLPRKPAPSRTEAESNEAAATAVSPDG